MNRTPFHQTHVGLGAKMIDFGGWDMPVHFKGILQEHAAVRERAGVFDISHMGQVWVAGPAARAYLDGLLSNDLSGLAPGKGQYNLMCRQDGGVVDDLYVYCLEPERFLVIINASRVPVDLQWMEDHKKGDVRLIEQPQRAALALQGPAAAKIMGALCAPAVNLARNEAAELPILDMEFVVARTGYTGEDGFELFAPAGHLLQLFPRLMKAGEALGLEPCGLGARDTLRLEMGYRLYGNDLDERHTALESGLGWAVKLEKTADFVGKEALLREKRRGPARRFIAFRLAGAGVARHGYPLRAAGRVLGEVTSGTFSPSLKAAIGMGYVDARAYAETKAAGAAPSALVHGREVPLEIVKLPFYRKPAAVL
jgi:aminomethyltransferase